MKSFARVAWVAWLLTALYYFFQYVLRTAPAVMMPQLGDAFGLSAVGVASLAGLRIYSSDFPLRREIDLMRTMSRILISAS